MPSRGTITGSIGVVGGKLVTGGLYEKLGMNTEIISRGKNSGHARPTQPFTPDERKVWTKVLEETYHEFVSKAAEGRKMAGEGGGAGPGPRLHRPAGRRNWA